MEVKKLAWVLLASALLSSSVAWAAEAAEAAEPATKLMPRAALLPETESMAAELMPVDGAKRGLDGYQWLDSAAQQGLLVHRAAYQMPGKGVVLLVSADSGAHSGSSLLGQLRLTLPSNDWHSYLVGLPLQGQEPTEQHRKVLAQRVIQAFELLQAAHPQSPVVVFGEGSVCDALATLLTPDGALVAAGAVAGLVLLNQPPPLATDGAVGILQIPTLMLQVLPNRYPAGYPLAQAVELRQLPRVSTRQPKSLVVRQVQGWLRQFEAPVLPPLG